ncbi:MAG TPA: hypothetical protein DEA08_27195, partial [Planctomycetes bacterium]|nr:hypothetical protein [Planctomycetota bacterium]
VAAQLGAARAALGAAYADWEALGQQTYAAEVVRILLGKPRLLAHAGEIAAALHATQPLSGDEPLRP